MVPARDQGQTKYAKQSLIEGEAVLFRTTLHRIALAIPVVVLGLMTPIFIFVSGPMVMMLVIAGIVVTVMQGLRYRNSEFVLTGRRIIIKTGWLHVTSLELLLSKVESITVSQTWAGQIFDYGTLIITGTGSTHELLRSIAAPQEFRKRVQTLIASG